MPRCCAALALACSLWAAGRLALAEEEQAKEPALPPVSAMVNGEPVFVAEVEASLQKIAKPRNIAPQAMTKARAEVLRQLINQHLALAALKRDGSYFTESEIDKDLVKTRQLAQSQKQTLEQFAARRGITIDTLRNELAWQRAWTKYLDQHLADELEVYFNAHHKDLDGTLVRASHILLRAEKAGETTAQQVERAEKLREEITSGKISFEDAAKKYSAGPSRQNGGDIGFFPRYGVMVDDFSKAAFGLEKGEISQPITTPFGTHLIQVTDIRPGNKQWTQVVDQIKSAASHDLFERIAKAERETAKIEFTGKTPHFKPGTDELVPGDAAAASK